MKNDIIRISGMSCGHCQASVEKVLQEIPGMTDVKVVLQEGKALVSYDDNKLSMDKIKAAIEDAGYEVKN